jgi:Uma2 family endonuclease
MLADRLEDIPMSMPKSRPTHTVDQYLALERASTERHEYVDGQIFAMAGESGAHGDISMNVAAILHSQLKGKPCRARTKDTKVRSGPIPQPRQSTTGLYSYPDVVVVCGEPDYHDAFTDVILNPTVLVEVLSPTTEAFDRGEKFTRYQMWNPTLSDYVLVAQDRPQVEHFGRQPDGSWSYQRFAGLDAEVVLASIGCTLKLADVYDRIVFSEQPPADSLTPP